MLEHISKIYFRHDKRKYHIMAYCWIFYLSMTVETNMLKNTYPSEGKYWEINFAIFTKSFNVCNNYGHYIFYCYGTFSKNTKKILDCLV